MKTNKDRRYIKNSKTISKKDDVFSEHISTMEKKVKEYFSNPTDETWKLLCTRYKLHPIIGPTKVRSGVSTFSNYSDKWKFFQAHIPSRARRGTYVALMAVNKTINEIDFVICGNHKDTTG